MKKPLTIGLLTAAIIAGALSLVRVDSANHAPAAVLTEAAVVTEAVAADGEAAPAVIRMAQLAVSANAPAAPYMLDYQRGPRIIHVPQPGEGTQERTSDRAVKKPAARASLERRPEPSVTADDEEDEVEVAPPPRPRAPAPKPRAAAAPPQPPAATTPRWKLRSETPPPPPPPPPGPRRAVLSAPPPGTLGPTPIRPTPRFDSKAADRNEKFAAPREPVASPPIVTESPPPRGYSPPATPKQPSDDVTSA
ncbi:MAG: hypothetical protein PSV22_04895, partial [Pseudolabrys sp.]|nr:hypothetical protein [Pseudolabrys sp.]